MRRSRGIVSWAALLVALLVAPLGALTGCGAAPGPGGAGDGYSQEREWAVAGDEDATPAEIIEQGLPADVAVAGPEGRQVTAVTWSVSSDDGEGPQQGAWRLYAEDGSPITDGKLGIVHEQGARAELRALPDGFLLVNYTEPALLHLGLDGSVEPVEAGAGAAVPTAPGDLLLETGYTDGPRTFYRPSDKGQHPLGKIPSENPQDILMDTQGVVTVLLPWEERPTMAQFLTSATGQAPWQKSSVPLEPEETPLLGMRQVGERALLPIGRFTGEDRMAVTSVASRTGPDQPWTRIPVRADGPIESYDVSIDALPDRRLLLGTTEEGVFLQDGDRFVPLDLPAAPDSVQPMVSGDRIWVVDHVEHALWSSADGTQWERFDR